MPLGNVPPENIGGVGRKSDPRPPEVLRISEDLEILSKQLAEKAYVLDQLAENDTRKERYKTEIQDGLGRMHRELLNLYDYKDELSAKALKIIEGIDKDIKDTANYLDDDWPAYPFSKFVDDTKALYEEILG